MADMEKDMEGLDDADILEFTDEEGNSFLYILEEMFMVDDNKIAVLVPVHEEDEEHEHEHEHCDCGCEDEDAAWFAKVVTDESGEDTYLELSDDEFNAAVAAYEELHGEDE